MATTAEQRHYAMSKKIAQLTKVIYALNCKVEDNDEQTAWMQRMHREEVARLTEECARLSALCKSEVDAAVEAKAAALTAVESKHVALLHEARAELTLKLTNMRAEVEQCEKTWEARAREAEQASAASTERELAKLREVKDAESANLVKEYNERYKTMLAEQLDAKESMEAELNGRWTDKYEQLVKTADRARKDFVEQISAATRALETSKAALDEAEARCASQSTLIRQLEGHVQQLEQSQADLGRQLEAEARHRGVSENMEGELHQRIAQLEGALTIAKETADAAEDHLQQSRATVAKLATELDALTTDHQAVKSAKGDLLRQLEDCRIEVREATSARAALEARLEDLLQRCEGSASRFEEEHAMLLKAQESIKVLQARLESRAANHKGELAELREAHQRALVDAQRDALSSNDAQREHELAEIQSRMTLQLEEMAAAHETHNTELHQQHQEQLRSVEGQLASAQRAIAQLQAELGDIKAQREQLNQKLRDSEECRASLEGEQRERAAGAEATIAQLRDEILSLQKSGTADADALRDARYKDQAVFTAQLEAMEQAHQHALQALRDEEAARTRAAEASHGSCINQLMEGYRAKMRETNAEAADNMSAALREAERRFAEERDVMDRQRREEQAARAAAAEAWDNERRALEARVAAADEAAKALERQSAGDLKDAASAVARLEAELAAREEAHGAALRAAHADAEGRLEEHKRQWDAKLARARQDAQQTLDSATAAHEEKTRQLQEMSATYVRVEEKRHFEAMEAFRQQSQREHANAMKELRTQHNTSYKQLQQDSEAALSRLRDELAQVTHDGDEANRVLRDVRRALETTQAQLRAAEQSLEETRRQTLNELQREAAGHATKVKEMSELHEKQLNDVAREHKAAIDECMRQHAEERHAQQSVVDRLQTALKTLQHKYDYRESRSEDVEIINNLLADNQAKKAALEKAYADMQQYKLELVNREENYNKVFNRKPVVAAPATADGATSATLPSIKPHRKSSHFFTK